MEINAKSLRRLDIFLESLSSCRNIYPSLFKKYSIEIFKIYIKNYFYY